MESKAGAQISKRAFTQSVLILFILMMAAGIMTRVIPAGSYQRVEVDGRWVIDPNSFTTVNPPDYPIWRWFTAPVEVLGSEDGLLVIVIIVFILMVGGAFAVLERSGILREGIARLVHKYGGKKYALLLVISFVFMALGAFFGIFEEVVPLVPVMLALSYTLGWDSLVGLGMSILATNMGFSAAITNPFTIGIAQKIAGLPLFSGAWFRIPIFLAIYGVFSIFLLRYARKVEKNPQSSLVYEQDKAAREKFLSYDLASRSKGDTGLKGAIAWLGISLVLIFAVLIGGPFIPGISDYALPLVGLLFLIGGVGSGKLAGMPWGQVGKTLVEGFTGIAPGILLILMAVSVKHIVLTGGVLDTILQATAGSFSQASPLVAAVLIYFLALLIEFFIGSGSAKAFLMMPILLPLADLVGVTRQVTVTAYCFGDGFSNMIYPTNPVLLIVLGLTVVSYTRWVRWTAILWLWVLLVTVVTLGIGVLIHLGPF
jgi:uncharacterized ion transporter superfamily protein YfcC